MKLWLESKMRNSVYLGGAAPLEHLLETKALLFSVSPGFLDHFLSMEKDLNSQAETGSFRKPSTAHLPPTCQSGARVLSVGVPIGERRYSQGGEKKTRKESPEWVTESVLVCAWRGRYHGAPRQAAVPLVSPVQVFPAAMSTLCKATSAAPTSAEGTGGSMGLLSQTPAGICVGFTRRI